MKWQRNEARWRKIIGLLAEGRSNQELMEEMSLSLSGVKWKIQELYRANGLYSQADQRRLIVLAVQGKLRLPESKR